MSTLTADARNPRGCAMRWPMPMKHSSSREQTMLEHGRADGAFTKITKTRRARSHVSTVANSPRWCAKPNCSIRSLRGRRVFVCFVTNPSCRVSSSPHGLRPSPPLQRHQPWTLDLAESLSLAIGPLDDHGIHLRGFAQSEMQLHIAG